MANEPLMRVNLQVGAVVSERYELLDRIGRGGMSEVYRARDRHIERDVAVKLLHRHLAADEEAIKRFQREAVATSELKHQNIVDVFAFGVWESRPYIVMELIEGTNLANVLEAEGPLSRARAIPIFLQVIDALETAHAHGIVHRDLKPGNIMLVGANQTVKVVDFGIAKILPESGKEMQKITQTGELFGTVLYMSPEQCMTNPLDGKSDIYSLGCIMYEALEGEPPMVASSSFAVMARHLNERPADGNRIDAGFMEIIRQCLEKQPEKRPSASQLKAMLANGQWKSDRRLAPGRVALGALMGVLLAAIVAISLRLMQRLDSAPPGNPPARSESPFPKNEVGDWLNHRGKFVPKFDGNKDATEDESAELQNALHEPDAKLEEEKLIRFIQRYGATKQYIYDLAEAQGELGYLYIKHNRFSEAARALNRCMETLRPYKQDKPVDYYSTVQALAQVEENLGNMGASVRLYEEVVGQRRQLLEIDPSEVFVAENKLAGYYASLENPSQRQRGAELFKMSQADRKRVHTSPSADKVYDEQSNRIRILLEKKPGRG